MPTIRDAILYHVDKGTTRRQLLDEFVECEGTDDFHEPHHTHDMTEIQREIDTMLSEGVLTQGSAHGVDDFIVVTEWMPHTATSMCPPVKQTDAEHENLEDDNVDEDPDNEVAISRVIGMASDLDYLADLMGDGHLRCADCDVADLLLKLEDLQLELGSLLAPFVIEAQEAKIGRIGEARKCD